jgi:hypothetical protein
MGAQEGFQIFNESCDRLDLSEAGLVGLQDVAAQAVGDKLSFAAGLDQASRLELFHVVGDGRRGDLAAAANGFAGESVARTANAAQQIEPARVGESTGDQVDAFVGEHRRGHTLC